MSDEVTESFRKMQEMRSEVSNGRIAEQPSGRPLIVFMTPAFDHNVTLGFLKSYVETIILLANSGYDYVFQSFGGDPYLAKVRNLLVSVCLKKYPQADSLFFLDADVEWDAQGALRIIQRSEDVVAGVYPKKNDRLEFPANFCFNPKTKGLIEQNGLVKAELVPTGFLRIKRHVYEKMAAQSPRYRDGTGGNEECWNLFEMGFCGDDLEATGLGQWWGEDYAFCRRLLNNGYDIWIEPDINFGHRGSKTWRHNYNLAMEQIREGTARIVDEENLLKAAD